MTASAQKERPSWPRLVGMQFNLILRSGRWVELVGGIVVLLGLSILMASVVVPESVDGTVHTMRNAQGPWTLLLLLLISAWPALLWRGESPARRMNHWSLPVPRGQHDLARVAAGGLWVLIGVVLIGLIRMVSLPATFTSAYAVAFTSYALGLVTLYCLSSIAAVVTAYPARWFFGLVVGYTLVAGILTDGPDRWVGGQPTRDFENIVDAPLRSEYGFLAATVLNAGIVSNEIDLEQDSVTARLDSSTFEDYTAIHVTPGWTRVPAATGRPSTLPPSASAADSLVEVRTVAMLSTRSAMSASALWIAGAIVVMLAISASRHEH